MYQKGLIKNTLLGLAVFESYGAVVEFLDARSLLLSSTEISDEHDPYARVSVPAHILAGSVGGSAQAFLSLAWKGIAAAVSTAPSSSTLPGLRSVVYHATAHASLFGSYEGTKRAMLETFRRDDETKHHLSSVEYLGVVGIAGGLAGQVQHLVSYYTEHLLLLQKNYYQQQSFTALARPTVRPLLVAFLPSSIAFIAFEYGRYN